MTEEEFMIDNNIKIFYKALPKKIYGFIFRYLDFNLIVINKNISDEKKKLTILHEFAHIELNHIYKKEILDFKIENLEDEADRYIEFILNEIN